MTLKRIIPFIFLGIISVISFLFSVGLIIGYIVGRYFPKELSKRKTKFQAFIFHIRNWRVHLHHWFLSILTIFLAITFGYFFYFPIIFYGILGGLIFEDIYWDRKWYKILSRKV